MGFHRHDAGDDVVEDGHDVGHAFAGAVLEEDFVPAELADGGTGLPDQEIAGEVAADLRDAGEVPAVGTVLVESETADALAGTVLGVQIQLGSPRGPAAL